MGRGVKSGHRSEIDERLHDYELENETTERQEQRAESNKDHMTTDNGLHASGATRAIYYFVVASY
jgi:hypothetical protein